MLHSDFSLSEVRVLYELGHRSPTPAAEIAKDLGLDAGYLSRMLRRFDGLGYLERASCPGDARQSLVSLTPAGRSSLDLLEHRSQEEVATWLGSLTDPAQARLVEAMGTIETLLAPTVVPPEPYLLRPPHAGDLGWIVERHGALYAAEYGFDDTFEALVADIVARFVREFDPARERCWIAERDGERIGSVMVVQASPTTAKLRLLLVEPSARGLGIGQRLVAECVAFARERGYANITLWTHDILHAARRLYAAAGFRCMTQEPQKNFSREVVTETWQLDLAPPARVSVGSV
jgi:DNA-binding MarR family transcriptional regulator/N-acetylglutamate synthase-like GNAT family acetyltransferase